MSKFRRRSGFDSQGPEPVKTDESMHEFDEQTGVMDFEAKRKAVVDYQRSQSVMSSMGDDSNSVHSGFGSAKELEKDLTLGMKNIGMKI